MTDGPISPEEVERLHPEARTDRAAETPAQPDAEQLESALREGGPLVHDDPEVIQARRELPTEDGPGTSLT